MMNLFMLIACCSTKRSFSSSKLFVLVAYIRAVGSGQAMAVPLFVVNSTCEKNLKKKKMLAGMKPMTL